MKTSRYRKAQHLALLLVFAGAAPTFVACAMDEGAHSSSSVSLGAGASFTLPLPASSEASFPAANIQPDDSGCNGSSGSDDRLDLDAVWRKASLTEFESYPAPNSRECIEFGGCKWAGMFAALEGKQPESWVRAHNIAAVHSKHFDEYKLKTLRLRKSGKEIDVKVYDMCSDSDCNGCCTRNARPSGFLIDIEKYTAQRFGVPAEGQVEWRCLDCD
ncbi:hypothetical protein WME94_30180 [Sorangium sp. So ce429]